MASEILTSEPILNKTASISQLPVITEIATLTIKSKIMLFFQTQYSRMCILGYMGRAITTERLKMPAGCNQDCIVMLVYNSFYAEGGK